MNYDQITGIIRAIVPPAVAYCAAKGWIPAGSGDSILAAAIAIAAAIWSVQNNKTGKVVEDGK